MLVALKSPWSVRLYSFVLFVVNLMHTVFVKFSVVVDKRFIGYHTDSRVKEG